MPLRDHFRPPLDDRHSWDELHGGWPMVVVQYLNRLLPAGYQAAPQIHLGTLAEIDIAAFEDDHRPVGNGANVGNGGVATAVWAPAKPRVDVETELPEADEYEVRVYDVRHGRELVAAIEIVSPSNKDRPEHRAQFVTKCAKLLRHGVAVSIVDPVTIRHFNLYAELLAYIGRRDAELSDPPSPIYASSCRLVKRGQRKRLQTWFNEMSIGQPLPTLPVWLSHDLAIPLDLEVCYEQACRDLRIT